MEKRVFLRAFELGDYKTTIKWRNNPEIVGGIFSCQRRAKRNG